MILGPNEKPLRRVLGFNVNDVHEDDEKSGAGSAGKIEAEYEPRWRGGEDQRFQPPYAKWRKP